MTTLHLGVIESKYANSKESTDTGDVASILEKNYGVLTGFAVTNSQQIADTLADSYAGALETIVMGGMAGNPASSAMSKISTMMKKYISSREAEWVLAPGVKGHPVPTAAALKGVNHRLKSKRGARRPSFRDTGLYENSLIAWME